ncbi:hypothetical protein CWI41_060090 [Ordospora colligata]|nr:hypothetical protein CWI41_060090 [Ordospora colligata]
MDCGTVCPICFSEYTSAGGHRIVSLGCGHLFGSQCIQKWAGRKAKIQCPICTTITSCKQIRPIYALKVTAVDNSNEQMLYERLQSEEKVKMEFMENNKSLLAQIEQLKYDLMIAKSKVLKDPCTDLHRNREFAILTGLNSFGTLIEYDESGCIMILTYKQGNAVGIRKFGCYDFSKKETVLLGECSEIRAIAMSPFADGVGLVAVGTVLNVINIYSAEVILRCDIECAISSMCFDEEDRNMVYCGDDSGCIHFVCLSQALVLKSIKICKTSIHSVFKKAMYVFACTFHNAYKVLFSGECINYDLDMEPYSICTSMYGRTGRALFTLRDADFGIRHFLCSRKEVYFRTGIKQIRRHRDRIYGDYLYVCDDKYNSIRVIDMHSLEAVYTYTFREQVLDFCITKYLMFILTRSLVHVFSGNYSFKNKSQVFID